MFTCLSSDWATTTGRLHGPTNCLAHKDGGIPLNALPMETTSKLAGKLTVPGTGSNDQIMFVFANIPTSI